MTKKKSTLIEHFKNMTVPRLKRKPLHKLDDIFLSVLKGNQSTLYDDVILFFENTPKSYIEHLASHKTIEKGHGRIEEREVTSCNNIHWLSKEHEHPYLASIVRVKSRWFYRDAWSEETRYFFKPSKVRNRA
jgi:hypothetical protein